VRDILWVDDLCGAYWNAWEKNVVGQIYNMGGGIENTISLLELLDELKSHGFDDLAPKFSTIRPGDQPVYVANAQRARAELGWVPSVAPRQGVRRLIEWVQSNRDLVSSTLGF
jgi:CDP-paratose 2-epimerase